MSDESCDVIVIGGGPAGSTAAYILARAGVHVILLEKNRFPRFAIGESILPVLFPLLCELGLESAFRKIPHVPKLGAEFAMGDDPNTTRFTFSSALIPGSWTFNVERALFDKMLLDEAQKAGATVRQETPVRQIEHLADGDVRIKTENGRIISARYLLDASSHACVVGRHLNTRRTISDPALHKVAYFAHFKNVERLSAPEEGYPSIIMTKEGWFWLIAINNETTSVGFVCHPDFPKRIGVPPQQLLVWAVERCPVVKARMRNAVGPEKNEILSDFSYTCKPYAGEGYFLIGDAACFLDPIFSTGVTLAMVSAREAANQVQMILRNERSPAAARRKYIRFITGSTNVFWQLIRSYYTHSFRELFLHGQGPLNVRGAVNSVLAGHVFPRPPFCLRWRLHFFNLCMFVNKFIPLVPRRKAFSLLDAA